MDQMNNCDSSNFPAKAELLCFVCLNVFTDPVVIPCGHNFCMSCLVQFWNRNHYHCPLCEEEFVLSPKSQINHILKDHADEFKKNFIKQPQVLCDACTREKHEALKSCLDCVVTFCKSHLEPHYNVPNLKKHKLIKPVENLESHVCKNHRRPLELKCSNDGMFLCQFCTEGKHKNHKVTLLKEESDMMKVHLKHKQLELSQMIRHRMMKVLEIRKSVEQKRMNTERGKLERAKVFRVLIDSIERSHAELMEVMEEKQNAAEKQAEGFIQDLQQEIIKLKRRETELEQLLHTEAHLSLLQVYPSICIPPPTKNWTEISVNNDLNVEDVRRTLSELQKTLNKKLTDTINENLKENVYRELKRIHQYAVDVTLDSDTAYPFLILSEDGKEVTYGNTMQNSINTLKQFTRYSIVLGEQSFSTGRFYYEVQVGRKTEWSLGVCRESVNRKNKIKLTPEDGFWTIRRRPANVYKACDEKTVLLSLRKKPQKVGVFVDYEEGLVSFYDVENRSHLYSFTGETFTEKLYPYFSPSVNQGGRNLTPLIISPIITEIQQDD